MKVIIIALTFIAAASAAIDQIPIVRLNQDVSFDGTYQVDYETGNGIKFQEKGVLKNAGNKDTEAEEVSGTFSFKTPEGIPIELAYVANENGFQPQGAHLPVAPVDDNTPPPIPAAILRALAWIEAHPSPESKGLA